LTLGPILLPPSPNDHSVFALGAGVLISVNVIELHEQSPGVIAKSGLKLAALTYAFLVIFAEHPCGLLTVRLTLYTPLLAY